MSGKQRALRLTPRATGPGPRAAWRALLDADAAVRDATPDEYEAAELAAQHAREVFATALQRAGT